MSVKQEYFSVPIRSRVVVVVVVVAVAVVVELRFHRKLQLVFRLVLLSRLFGNEHQISVVKCY